MKIAASFAVLALLFSVFAAGCTGGQQEEAPKNKTEEKEEEGPTETLKMSVVVGAATPWGAAAQKWAKQIEEKTDLDVRVYLSGQLFAGKQTNEFQLLSQGAADFAIGSTINWSPQITEMNLFTLPFFFPRDQGRAGLYKAVDAVEQEKAGDMIKQTISDEGVKFLAWGENGFRQITNSKRAIKNPEDLKDLKIRIVGSPMFIDTFKAFGANPVQMNWGEATTAFQKGVVDGQENPTNVVLIPVKIYSYHQYMTQWDYAIDPLMFSVNKETWNSLTSKQQRVVRQAAKDVAKWEKARARVGLDDGTALQTLKDEYEAVPNITDPAGYLEEQGMSVTPLTKDQRQEFKSQMSGIYDKWVPRVGEDLVDAARSDIEDKLGFKPEIPD